MKSNAIKFNGELLRLAYWTNRKTNAINLTHLFNPVLFHFDSTYAASTFTGTGSLIADESAAIYQVVKGKIDESRNELSHLEEAVKEQMATPKKKKKKGGSAKAATSPASSTAAEFEIPEDFNLDIDSDSD